VNLLGALERQVLCNEHSKLKVSIDRAQFARWNVK